MKNYTFLLCLCFCSVLSSQNLAPNANFENFGVCPSAGGGFSVDDWYLPTTGTSDYFNECAGNVLGVPINLFGFQESQTGNGYVGGFNYSLQQPTYREYFQALLESTLVVGCYELTIIYNRADATSFSDGLGMYLSNGIPASYIGLSPQLRLGYVNSDIVSWQTLTTEFFTDGGETHITIGNFDEVGVTQFSEEDVLFADLSYIYIDSVSVRYIGSQSTPFTVDLGDDVELCPSDFPITIGGGIPNGIYTWNTGETSSTIEITEAGVYSISVLADCFTATDEIVVSVFEEPEIIVEEYEFCEGESVTVELDGDLGIYTWPDGSNGASYTFDEAGTYVVSLEYDCGDVTEEIVVVEIFEISIPPIDHLDLCISELPFDIDLSSLENDHNEFLWSTGSTNSQISITEAGVYSVEVYNDCFSDTDEFEVEVFEELPLDIPFESFIICDDEEYVIDPGDIEGEFEWQDGSDTDTYTAVGPGLYTLTITNVCGVGVYQFFLLEEPLVEVDLGIDVSMCPGDVVEIESSNGVSLSWNTGGEGNSLWVFEGGEYIGTYYGICQVVSDTIIVEENGAAPELILEDSLTNCSGGVLLVIASDNPSGVDFEWNDGTGGAVIAVTEEGNYIVTAENSCGVVVDSVYVSFGDPLPNIEIDVYTEICDGDMVAFEVEGEGVEVEWSTGMVGETIELSESGKYWVDVSNDCGTISDTFEIEVINMPEKPSLGDDLFICEGDTVVLEVDSVDVEYAWSTGESGLSIIVAEAGLYILTSSNNCGESIDSIEVIDFGQSPKVDIGSDQSFCIGDTLYLAVEGEYDSILWNTGSNDAEIEVTEEGEFIVMVENECGFANDTIIISISNEVPNVDLGVDQVFCPGDSVLLEVSNPIGNIEWSTGSEMVSIIVDKEGWYSVMMSSTCGNSSDSVYVSELIGAPEVDLGDDLLLCDGDTIILSVVDEGDVLWNNGSIQNEIIVTEIGEIIVVVSNDCGVDIDTVLVEMSEEIPTVDLGVDKEICPGDSVLLEVESGNGSIAWNTGSESSSIYVTEEGWYSVFLSSSCGTSSDSVYVSELSSAPVVNLGADTTLCFIENLVIDLDLPDGVDILWSNGITEDKVTFLFGGTYWVEVSNSCGMSRDTIVLDYYPAIGFWALPADTLICDESEYIVGPNLELEDVTFSWSTGEEEAFVTITASGEYSLTIGNECEEKTETIEVVFGESPNEFLIEAEDTICEGEQIFLDGNQGEKFDYEWQDGTPTSSYTITEPGAYTLEVSNQCGTASASIEVVVVQSVGFDVAISDEYIVCKDESVFIDLLSSLADYVEWADGSTEFVRNLTEAGDYSVHLYNDCRDTLLNLVVVEENCADINIFIPNIFTPNKDGANDFFTISYPSDWTVLKSEISIFNRWGEKVFYSEEPDFKWDGGFKGSRLNPGVYVYVFVLEMEADGQKYRVEESGDLTLVR